MSQQKYVIEANVKMVEDLMRGLKKYRKQMIQGAFAGRYLEYPFMKLNEDTHISLKFDRWEKYKNDPYAK